MEEKGKSYSKELLGRTIVSKSGKKFGEVGDLIFEVGSGELIHLLLLLAGYIIATTHWQRNPEYTPAHTSVFPKGPDSLKSD